MNTKTYRRDCVFGALGALFMLAGDLCLSIVPASEGDSGLFAREAYLNGGFQPWRLPLLLATGLIGMGYVALVMLHHNFHGVGVALCRG